MTLVFTYYDNPLMLSKQIEEWKHYPEEVKIILVDDGSPNYPAESRLLDSLTIYRINEDIYQNTFGARNLGFEKAELGWVFNLDLDTVVPATSIERLLKKDLNPQFFYRVNRYKMLNMEGRFSLMNQHSDTYLMTKSMYWALGGYNERLTGYKNGAAFKFKQQMKTKRSRLLEGIWTEWYGSDLIADASPINKRDMEPGMRSGNKTLNFTYEQVI